MKKPITTTLAKIREHQPCSSGWRKLYKSLGGIKKYGENTPIRFSQIVQSNGLDDAVWCLCAISCPEHEKEVLLFAADCAERVLHFYEEEYPDDDRPRKAINTARDYAVGIATEQELATATSAAWAAWAAAKSPAKSPATSSAWAAWAAAKSPATSSAYVAYVAAKAAVNTAAYAAYVASKAAASVWSAEKEAQKKLLIERFG